MIIWAIGAGGLLGSALRRQALRHGIAVFDADPIAWGDPDATERSLQTNARAFRERVGDQPWAVLWAAGRAATASTPDEAERELSALGTAIDALSANRPAGPGAWFLTSSAGGVYAGSAPPPFDEHTAPKALSAYGELKLAQEALASDRLQGVCPVVIGRISNLYGPGQDLAKLQGLISRLALAAVTRQPITMFVSLDTIRDYIDVDDAATVALHWTSMAVKEQPREPVVRIIASGQPVSLGALIHLMQDVAHVRVPLAVGSHDSASAQARDLRLTPSDDGTAQRLIRTPLPAGVKRVHADILQRFQGATVPQHR